jgi:hypothetical protein
MTVAINQIKRCDEPMRYDMENIVKNIDFSMTMEDMPLTDEDKKRLRDCLNGVTDVDEILRDVIKKHTLVEK